MKGLFFLIAWAVLAFPLAVFVGKFIEAGSGKNGNSESVSDKE